MQADLFCGYKIYERPAPGPKLKLKPSLQVSDEFRKEIDDWLLQMFGYQNCVVPNDQIIVMESNKMIIVGPGMKEKLQRLITA